MSDYEVSKGLVRFLAAAIADGVSIERFRGGDGVVADDAVLDRMMDAGRPARHLRIWTNARCLVTTRRFASSPAFEVAAAKSRARGWPVHVRSSGGSAVVHRDGILNVSLVEIGGVKPVDIGRALNPLADLLRRGLVAIGLDPTIGRAPGSYCDGAANLLVRGRKVAGTACRVRRGHSTTGVLAHAVITVEGDVRKDIAAIEHFETALGMRRHYDIDKHTTIEDELRHPVKGGPKLTASR